MFAVVVGYYVFLLVAPPRYLLLDIIWGKYSFVGYCLCHSPVLATSSPS